MKRPVHIASVALVCLTCCLGLIAASCATIMQGTSQNVGIGSTPTGATVLLDQQPQGKTPVVAHLSRKDNHVMRVELDGYQPFETTFSRHVSGWVWGNIVFGGVIGLAVDAITGGLYKLTPEQVQAELRKEGASVKLGKDSILLTVTLHREADWEKIGQLQPDTIR